MAYRQIVQAKARTDAPVLPVAIATVELKSHDMPAIWYIEDTMAVADMDSLEPVVHEHLEGKNVEDQQQDVGVLQEVTLSHDDGTVDRSGNQTVSVRQCATPGSRCHIGHICDVQCHNLQLD